MAKDGRNCGICLLLTGLLLFVILLPLSFGYIDYYEFGISKRKSTGTIFYDKVYTRGRYHLGPDKTFITYQADAHSESFEELAVFSAGGGNESIGLAFEVDVDFTYFLIEDEIIDLHRELARGYKDVVVSRAKDAIKNAAISVTFNEYFQERRLVERKFRDAVRNRWNEKPSLHCTLDQFHLGRIRIPENVAQKQLEGRIQNERNDMEEFLQLAELEREETSVQVNRIELEKSVTLRTANANASLIRSKAQSEAERIKSEAQINGTRLVYSRAGITTQDHMTAYTYIRTLKNRPDLRMHLSYASPDTVVRTQGL
eukprot:CAMPEP_0198109084 /NCGR_PEP_ID=MMETSP1442-20131203/1101_1 /TAXON_ID= /ORGANISM="Craspedostauros australis, Strain CCMP3328" /LENGTH=313 /DNA_ID=CAMNT_0043764583 /DNA_START=134 /DNA_END=1075 /DNA_ORIENTATION=+